MSTPSQTSSSTTDADFQQTINTYSILPPLPTSPSISKRGTLVSSPNQTLQNAPQQAVMRVHIQMYTDPARTVAPSYFEPFSKDLIEGSTIKLGRQVKPSDASPVTAAPQNEAPQLPASAPASDSNEMQDLEMSSTPPASDTSMIQSAAPTASAPVPTSAVSARKNSKIIEKVWFKSKVVSRCHAEIWFHEGQVITFTNLFIFINIFL
jgi:hypothetical protein